MAPLRNRTTRPIKENAARPYRRILFAPPDTRRLKQLTKKVLSMFKRHSRQDLFRNACSRPISQKTATPKRRSVPRPADAAAIEPSRLCPKERGFRFGTIRTKKVSAVTPTYPQNQRFPFKRRHPSAKFEETATVTIGRATSTNGPVSIVAKASAIRRKGVTTPKEITRIPVDHCRAFTSFLFRGIGIDGSNGGTAINWVQTGHSTSCLCGTATHSRFSPQLGQPKRCFWPMCGCIGRIIRCRAANR